MEIRKGNINDAEGIAKVHISTWRTTYRGIIPDEKLDNMDLQKDIEKQKMFISKPEVSTYVCLNVDNEVIAYACCGENRDKPKEYEGELYAIYVLKNYQKQGLGKALVDKVIEDLKNRGYSSMILWTLEENSSRRFYESLGGELVGHKNLTYAGKKVKAVAYGWKSI